MNDLEEFEADKSLAIRRLGQDMDLRQMSIEWMARASRNRYSYHFTWLGLPIIQFPQDVVALQEIIWKVRPGLIVETGIARGGSLVFHASMLQLLGGDGMVVGVDVDIRSHNRRQLEGHPLWPRMRLVEGSSTSPDVVSQVVEFAEGRRPVLVVLDSNHTHEHVLEELRLYAPFVTKDSYLVVLDTVIEDLPEGYFAGRPWSKTRNPKTAVREFLATTNRFEVDREIENKLLITVAPEGFLRCIAE